MSQTLTCFESKASLHYFSMGLEFGEVPVSWKLGNIIPVFKKRKKEGAVSYWPVSLHGLGKIMKKVILGVRS